MDDRPKFNVAIIYEDGAAGKRAKHFYDRVIRELVDECDFSLELWSFQVLDYLRKVADRKGISFYTHTIFYLSTN